MIRRMMSGALLLCLLVISSSLSAAPEKLAFASDLDRETPDFRILRDRGEDLRLEFTLPALDLEKLDIDGQLFHALTIPGGSLEGEAGRPALPAITRLIAVPSGAFVTPTVTVTGETELSGYRLLPMQPDDAESFVMDRAAYAAPLSAKPAVEVGAPAILRDLRVVPVTFRPVSYDPVAGEVRVAHRMEVSFAFADGDTREPAPAAKGYIPSSFVSLYEDMVVNWGVDDAGRAADAEIGPGTVIYITPNNSQVTSRVQTLADWRRRQGYNVIQVTTATAGTSRAQILSYIQGQYNTVWPPLEHVVLVGDANGSYAIPCWYESLEAGGEGDHYYTLLAGADILSDVNIGRLSIQSLSDLDVIVDKIMTYEQNPPTSDPGWFTRACLAGDPTHSGATTIYVNQWLKEQLLNIGYTQVDTIWDGYFISQIVTGVSQGVSVFGYRGYWHMSDVTPSHILSMSNGDKLPFAIVVTCDTGSFSADATCRSEAFLRASNGGGIASVGTATIHTHTRYNNCYYQGAWHGALYGSQRNIGAAHTRGKLELYNNYFLSEPNSVEIWSVWNNLMGSPVVNLRTAVPTELEVEHASNLALGADVVPVRVTDGFRPVENALVALYKEDELRVTGYTDAAGEVLLPIADYSAGELLVTVTGLDLIPYLGSIQIGHFAGLTVSDMVIDDDANGLSYGNGDGVVNPGETIELSLELTNLGTSPLLNIDARMSCDDLRVDLLDDDDVFGTILGNAAAWSEGVFVFKVSPYAADGDELVLDFEMGPVANPWMTRARIPVQGARLSYDSYTWQGGGATLDPGESGGLVLEILNGGGLAAQNVEASLYSRSPWVQITDEDATVGTILAGGTADNGSHPFQVAVNADCPDGHAAEFDLVLAYGGGAAAALRFELPVGAPNSLDPTGPDAYGYYAFDSGDTGYEEAPVYDWLEIDPNFSGPGTSVGLTDFYYEQDDTKVLDLPFTFRYYGRNYDKISVCSNGWLAMGETSLTHYRNWSIPSAGSPAAMIAPFWDNLVQTSGGDVYYYHDAAEHKFYVEWSRVRTQGMSQAQIFEVVLLDPAHHPTETGDGEIVFQYQQIYNYDSTNGYGTVGIQSPDRTDGVLYTYWNQYTTGSSNLAANKAIRFLPLQRELTGEISVDPGQLTQLLMPESTGNEMLEIANTGDAGSVLHFAIEKISGELNGDLPTWLRPEVIEGDIAAGESAQLNIGFDTAGMELGDYHAVLRFHLGTGATRSVPVTLTVSDGTAIGEAPAALFLAQNHPNPFNPTTKIAFGLPEAGHARLEIFSVDGRRVRVLVDGDLPAGTHEAVWDGRDRQGAPLATGLYFYRLVTPAETRQSKMLLLK